MGPLRAVVAERRNRAEFCLKTLEFIAGFADPGDGASCSKVEDQAGLEHGEERTCGGLHAEPPTGKPSSGCRLYSSDQSDGLLWSDSFEIMRH